MDRQRNLLLPRLGVSGFIHAGARIFAVDVKSSGCSRPQLLVYLDRLDVVGAYVSGWCGT